MSGYVQKSQKCNFPEDDEENRFKEGLTFFSSFSTVASNSQIQA